MTLTSLLRLTNFLALGILLVLFPTPAHAQIGDLILLRTKIDIVIPELGVSWEYAKNVTMLKEGYMLSLDSVWFPLAPPFEHVRIANFTIVKNGETVKKISANQGDVFYYNKIIDGKECTIIEAKVEGIYLGTETIIVRLEKFYQYSDGSTVNEKEKSAANSEASKDAAPSEQWSKKFEGAEVRSVQQTIDGGYILVGWTWSVKSNRGNLDGLLIKIDGNGNDLWKRTFGGEGDDLAYSVQQTSDGGYIFAGWSSSSSPYLAGDYDIWLTKADENGNEIWNKTFRARSPSTNPPAQVQQTVDGGYIIAGWSGGFVWLIKTDADGNQQWDRLFEGLLDAFDTPDYVYSVKQTSDHGYILAGLTKPYRAGNCDARLIKTDADGYEQWNRTYGTERMESVFSVQQTTDGGYIFSGQGHGAWLVKTDTSGNEQWNKTFFRLKESDTAHSVQQTSDGGYIITGVTYSNKHTGWDAFLVKTDTSGNEEWSKTFGGTDSDYAYSVQQTTDGGYIIAGSTYHKWGWKGWLIKVGSDGNAPSEKFINGFEILGAMLSVVIILILKSRK